MGNSWRQQCAGCWARGNGQRAWEEQPSASHNCSHVVVPEGLRPSILVSPWPSLPCCNLWVACKVSNSGELGVRSGKLRLPSAVVPLTHLVLSSAVQAESWHPVCPDG